MLSEAVFAAEGGSGKTQFGEWGDSVTSRNSENGATLQQDPIRRIGRLCDKRQFGELGDFVTSSNWENWGPLKSGRPRGAGRSDVSAAGLEPMSRLVIHFDLILPRRFTVRPSS